MNVSDVMDEVGEKLKTRAGLRVPDDLDSVPAPCAFVSLPEGIDYTRSYNRGADGFELDVLVLVEMTSNRASRKAIAQYADGSGPKSVMQALDSTGFNTFTSCTEVSVTRCEFETVAVAGVNYLAATFRVEIEGPGA